MAKFAIIKDGVVENVIVADSWADGIDVTNTRVGIGWKYVDGEFVKPAQEATATTPYTTHFGFLSRLTPQERTAVRKATAQDDTLDDAMFLFNSADRIDVTLPETQQLVGYLALTGLISPERIPQILAPIEVTSPHAIL